MDADGKEDSRRDVALIHAHSWEGPIPDPESLAAYKALVADAPERILRMAEEEAKARRELEKADHEAENDARRNDVILYHNGVRRGQVLTFLIIMSCIGGSLYAARIGAHTLASILAGVSFTGIAYHLVSSIKRK